MSASSAHWLSPRCRIGGRCLRDGAVRGAPGVDAESRAYRRARGASVRAARFGRQALFQLDADCAEALWALDQPAGMLNRRAMVRDTLAALEAVPHLRAQVRARLSATATATVRNLEPAIRASLDPREAYDDAPGRDPHLC